MKRRTLKKAVAVALVAVAVVATAGRGTVQAMMVPTGAAHASAIATRDADLKTVRGALENRLVRQRLADMGLSSDEINGRLNRLDDRQLHQVAMRIEKQNPAGDAGISIIVAVAILLVVLLIVAFGTNHHHDDDHHDVHHDDTTTHTEEAPASGQPQTIIVK